MLTRATLKQKKCKECGTMFQPRGSFDKVCGSIECKVSNSSTNSVKRINNDAAVKAVAWISEFGKLGAVPAAVISGVFKVHNLESAQSAGLTIFWSHALDELGKYLKATNP